jgi:hypothetical protein
MNESNKAKYHSRVNNRKLYSSLHNRPWEPIELSDIEAPTFF